MPRLCRPSTFRARALRRNQTPAEQALWRLLRASQLGAKFRRQHPMGPFVLDFYCHQAALVVEVVGPYHRARAVRDRLRDRWLRAAGLTILHLTNHEVLATPDRALERIRALLDDRPAEPDTPLPRGEGPCAHATHEG